jgi:hypothetical protein
MHFYTFLLHTSTYLHSPTCRDPHILKGIVKKYQDLLLRNFYSVTHINQPMEQFSLFNPLLSTYLTKK